MSFVACPQYVSVKDAQAVCVNASLTLLFYQWIKGSCWKSAEVIRQPPLTSLLSWTLQLNLRTHILFHVPVEGRVGEC